MPRPCIRAAAAVLAAGLPGLAWGATLTFDGPICGGAACTATALLGAETGSPPGLDVTHDRDRGVPEPQPMTVSGDDDGDLTGDPAVGTPFASGRTAIDVVPLTGGAALATRSRFGA